MALQDKILKRKLKKWEDMKHKERSKRTVAEPETSKRKAEEIEEEPEELDDPAKEVGNDHSEVLPGEWHRHLEENVLH